jgi:hypothetical protein
MAFNSRARLALWRSIPAVRQERSGVGSLNETTERTERTEPKSAVLLGDLPRK